MVSAKSSPRAKKRAMAESTSEGITRHLTDLIRDSKPELRKAG
jgi:hypothetical protein